MQILSIQGHTARCHANGLERDVDIYLLLDQDIRIGDCIMVHVGYAIQRVSINEARTAWQLLEHMENPEHA